MENNNIHRGRWNTNGDRPRFEYPRFEVSYKDIRATFKTQFVDSQPGKVRQKTTTASEDRFISLWTRKNYEMTTIDMVFFLIITGIRISNSITARRLTERGLYARKSKVYAQFNRATKMIRSRWCGHQDLLCEEDWSQVLFNEESRFRLKTDSRHVFIWRQKGIRNLNFFVREFSDFDVHGFAVCGRE